MSGLNIGKLHALNAQERQFSDYNSDISYSNIRPRQDFFVSKAQQQFLGEIDAI